MLRLATYMLFILMFIIVHQVNSMSVYQSGIRAGKTQQLSTLAPVKISSTKHNTQTALILIGGLNAKNLKDDLYEWKTFVRYWTNNTSQDIQDKYSLLVFRYDGWNSLYKSADILAQGIQELLDSHNNNLNIQLIGYSQGGLISRILMSKYPDLGQYITKVITTATPHQGSVLTSHRLGIQLIDGGSRLTEWHNRKLANILIQRYKYLFTEQAWTNFDNQVPASAKYMPPEQSINKLASIQQSDLAKFYTYGSYYQVPSAFNKRGFFHKIFKEVLPQLVYRSSAGQLKLNRKLIYSQVYPDASPQWQNNLKYNDGLIPLSSSLWLRSCHNSETMPSNLTPMFEVNNYCPMTNNYRIFQQVLHLHWRIPSQYNIHDKAHPELPARHLYQWIIDDLLQ